MNYGCIGEKLTHSFSKTIHSLIGNYDYRLLEIQKSDLDSFMKSAKFKGINVTIPYKQAVIPYLDEISVQAKQIGAVNTIANIDGRLFGYNTDFFGMKALIEKTKTDLNNKKVLILGSGGTSKTAYAVAKFMKASEIIRVSRTGNDGAVNYDEVYKINSDAQIIINTTPVGMYPKIGFSPIDVNKFAKLEAVFDAVYNPLSSALVTSARDKGITAVGGLFMLVSQAVFAAQKFPDCVILNSDTDSIYKRILNQKRNIVLVGMPGCGKTTIGKALAEKLNKKFIDTDEEIIKSTNKKIPDIFEDVGEIGFRKIEADIIKNVSACQNSVIATGGGAILNYENIKLLKENGIIIFLDRPIDQIVTTEDRPLSSSRELLTKRYNERYNIYNSVSQVKINVSDDLNYNIDKVLEEI